MTDLEKRKSAAAIVTFLDGGENQKVHALVQKDGSFGGCCIPNSQHHREAIAEGCKMVTTTNGKYTRWKYGLITSDEL